MEIFANIVKGCVRYIFAIFCMPKRALATQGKIFFIPLRKLFSFLRSSNFNFIDIQISWRHQMHNHKLLNNLGSKHSLVLKFGQFM